jgi:hypothetical protein
MLTLPPAGQPILSIKLRGLFNRALMAAFGQNGPRRPPKARATHYRELAARVTDEQTRLGLLELAENYEALAREVQADDRPKSQ